MDATDQNPFSTFNANLVISVVQKDGTLSESAKRVLQPGLQFHQDDLRKYLVALVVDGTEYFITPDAEMGWANGLNGKVKVCESFKLFSSAYEAREFLLDRPFVRASRAVVYSLMRCGGAISLIPHARFSLSPSAFD